MCEIRSVRRERRRTRRSKDISLERWWAVGLGLGLGFLRDGGVDVDVGVGVDGGMVRGDERVTREVLGVMLCVVDFCLGLGLNVEMRTAREGKGDEATVWFFWRGGRLTWHDEEEMYGA